MEEHIDDRDQSLRILDNMYRAWAFARQKDNEGTEVVQIHRPDRQPFAGLGALLAGLSELAGLAMIIGAYIVGLSLSRTDLVNEVHNHLKGIYSILVPIFSARWECWSIFKR